MRNETHELYRVVFFFSQRPLDPARGLKKGYPHLAGQGILREGGLPWPGVARGTWAAVSGPKWGGLLGAHLMDQGSAEN